MNKIFKSALAVLGALDPTGIIDAVRPRDISEKTGIAEDIVLKVIGAYKETPEFKKAKMDHAQAMAQMGSVNLRALDTDASFSFVKGLLGSPRRWAVTILTSVIAYLGLTVGTKAIFYSAAVADPDAFNLILRTLGLTLAGVTGAYSAKYFGKG